MIINNFIYAFNVALTCQRTLIHKIIRQAYLKLNSKLKGRGNNTKTIEKLGQRENLSPLSLDELVGHELWSPKVSERGQPDGVHHNPNAIAPLPFFKQSRSPRLLHLLATIRSNITTSQIEPSSPKRNDLSLPEEKGGEYKRNKGNLNPRGRLQEGESVPLVRVPLQVVGSRGRSG